MDKVNFPPARNMIRHCLLFILAGVCFLLTVVRHILTGRLTYYFLNWNLLLAVIPWLISLLVSCQFIMKRPKVWPVLLVVVWLLFFPNSLYIITDLYYLNDHPEQMFWFDMIMILLFAWTGLLFGFFSLDRIKNIFIKKLTKVKNVVLSNILLLVGAFGVYLGRDLHWNSWDILFEPKEFFLDILDRFINPLGHGRTWGFTFLLWVFLMVIYWTLKLIQKKE